MIKFAAKYQKHLRLACRHEVTIYTYRYLRALQAGLNLKTQTSTLALGKYMLYTNKYHKAIISLSRTRNFCMLTGRTRGLYRGFQFSRMQVRHLVKEGSFSGVLKSSW